jgi:pyruvate dehydrogenase (quinone)
MRSNRNKPNHVSDEFARGARRPEPHEIQAAAEILNEGKKIAILAGRGALKAGKQLEQAAELLGAPIIKALLGKSCVPDDSPYTTGGLGLLGTLPSDEAMEYCDTLLIVGSCLPYIEFYPKTGQAICVQIGIDSTRIGLRYPADVAMAGDAVETLDALLPHLKKHSKSFLEKAQDGMKDWRELMHQRGTATDTPMKPQVVAYEVGKRLKSDAIVTSDSGTITTWSGPVLVEAVVDQNEPPMPAKVKPQQTLHFAESLARGTKDWEKIAATIAKDKVRELV